AGLSLAEKAKVLADRAAPRTDEAERTPPRTTDQPDDRMLFLTLADQACELALRPPDQHVTSLSDNVRAKLSRALTDKSRGSRARYVLLSVEETLALHEYSHRSAEALETLEDARAQTYANVRDSVERVLKEAGISSVSHKKSHPEPP